MLNMKKGGKFENPPLTPCYCPIFPRNPMFQNPKPHWCNLHLTCPSSCRRCIVYNFRPPSQPTLACIMFSFHKITRGYHESNTSTSGDTPLVAATCNAIQQPVCRRRRLEFHGSSAVPHVHVHHFTLTGRMPVPTRSRVVHLADHVLFVVGVAWVNTHHVFAAHGHVIINPAAATARGALFGRKLPAASDVNLAEAVHVQMLFKFQVIYQLNFNIAGVEAHVAGPAHFVENVENRLIAILLDLFPGFTKKFILQNKNTISRVSQKCEGFLVSINCW